MTPSDQIKSALEAQLNGQHHAEMMRSNALAMAIHAIGSKSNRLDQVLFEARQTLPEGTNLTETELLELLANHFLTFIQTGEFHS